MDDKGERSFHAVLANQSSKVGSDTREPYFRKALIFSVLVSCIVGLIVILWPKIYYNYFDTSITYYEVPRLEVMLRSTEEHDGYCGLKVKITLQLKNKGVLKVVKNATPNINNTITFFLSCLSREDLENNISLSMIQKELEKRINAIMPGAVDKVLIEEILVTSK
ncbi:flagellar basal body-associated FliL family protein [Candidatus Sneabacter namystus]|uniref:Flagellar protein FliL n=1 Tax=Candidatus Sneabacter namystus TaxID=2601646 RepID=A0A5C0UHY3_9RICK|nr:flagellar basal body-associated FliL family protein [Candidatus Sneabacter namystus]QEK39666.1 flagellar basal body-associated FliL family protein [Candidatus Sneabacter namystus]